MFYSYIDVDGFAKNGNRVWKTDFPWWLRVRVRIYRTREKERKRREWEGMQQSSEAKVFYTFRTKLLITDRIVGGSNM